MEATNNLNLLNSRDKKEVKTEDKDKVRDKGGKDKSEGWERK